MFSALGRQRHEGLLLLHRSMGAHATSLCAATLAHSYLSYLKVAA